MNNKHIFYCKDFIVGTVFVQSDGQIKYFFGCEAARNNGTVIRGSEIKLLCDLFYQVILRNSKHSNSHERLGQNFSCQYQYNINQKSDENKENYLFGDN